MRISDWSSDVCSSDLDAGVQVWTINIKETGDAVQAMHDRGLSFPLLLNGDALIQSYGITRTPWLVVVDGNNRIAYTRPAQEASPVDVAKRSEEHTSELQSLMRISYAVFCLKQKQKDRT